MITCTKVTPHLPKILDFFCHQCFERHQCFELCIRNIIFVKHNICIVITFKKNRMKFVNRIEEQKRLTTTLKSGLHHLL